MRRQTKHGRPSHGTVVAYLALFVAIGGSAYAAKQLPKNSVGSKQIRKGAVKTGDLARNAVKAGKLAKNAVPTNRLRDNAVTGAKVNEATLGTVPSANLANVANSANSLAPLEDWHLVGAPGEPGFLGSWENGPAPDGSPAAFFKDHEGIVHLRGMVTGAGLFVFQLPLATARRAARAISHRSSVRAAVSAPSRLEQHTYSARDSGRQKTAECMSPVHLPSSTESPSAPNPDDRAQTPILCPSG